MALLFAATYPERVRALVNYGSLPRFVRGPNFPWREPKHEYLAEWETEAEVWGTEETRVRGSRARGGRQPLRRSGSGRARTGCSSAPARSCSSGG